MYEKKKGGSQRREESYYWSGQQKKRVVAKVVKEKKRVKTEVTKENKRVELKAAIKEKRVKLEVAKKKKLNNKAIKNMQTILENIQTSKYKAALLVNNLLLRKKTWKLNINEIPIIKPEFKLKPMFEANSLIEDKIYISLMIFMLLI